MRSYVAKSASAPAIVARGSKGERGERGEPGRRSFDWAQGTVFEVGDLAVHSGVLYRCASPHTASATFTPSMFEALTGGGGAPVGSVIPASIPFTIGA